MTLVSQGLGIDVDGTIIEINYPVEVLATLETFSVEVDAVLEEFNIVVDVEVEDIG